MSAVLRLRPLLTVLTVAAAVATVAAGCGDPDQVTSGAAEPSTRAVGTEPARTSAPTSSGPTSDVCALLADAEVAGVLGPVHVVSATTTFGSLADATGAQCVWTDDVEGDTFASDATNLELVLYVPDGPNPPPAEAPAPGSDAIVADGAGVWFATADRVVWLRVTGARSGDVTLVAGARDLVAAVRARL